MMLLTFSLQKAVEKVSPILVTLMSRSDSNFERSNINLKEDKRDDVDSDSNGFDYCVRKSEGKILWFSADCIMMILDRFIAKIAWLIGFCHKAMYEKLFKNFHGRYQDLIEKYQRSVKEMVNDSFPG